MRLTRWNQTVPPAAPVLRRALQTEGLSVLEWTDSPGTVYAVHAHPFGQVRVILSGQLRIGLPETAEEIVLTPGDRLDLDADVPHWEDVDGNGATYLAATPSEANLTAPDYGSVKSWGHGQ